jgi:hypothetical protein
VIEENVATGRGSRVEPLEELTPDAIPRSSDLTFEPACRWRKLVGKAAIHRLALGKTDGVRLCARAKVVKHCERTSARSTVGVAAVVLTPPIATAFDDGARKIFGRHG